jgi:predicted transcriptional regulator
MTSTNTVDESMEYAVTETLEATQVIAAALAVIDRGLADMQHRELVSTDEVADLLLDVRTILAGSN